MRWVGFILTLYPPLTTAAAVSARVGRVKARLLIIPGSPALVEPLAAADATSRRLAETVRSAALLRRRKPYATVDVVCSMNQSAYTAWTGSLRAWGAPQVTVGDGNYLGELVTRYLLGERNYRGARDHLTPLDPEALTGVVVDGPAGLTPRAPLAMIDTAPAMHEALRQLVATGKSEGLTHAALAQSGVCEPQRWLELSQLNVAHARLLDDDATLGVGRYVGEWEVNA